MKYDLHAIVSAVLAGTSISQVAREHGVSRQYMTRLFWRGMEAEHPQLLARWRGAGRPDMRWLRWQAGKKC